MSAVDDYEKEILAAYEAGELPSVSSAEERARLREAARATGAKDRRVNIRLSSVDLHDLQARALQEGVPYQSLITSILHKYTAGRLVEATEHGSDREETEPREP